MKRSILTEKISRRGFHLSREYAIDPLEILFVRDVMRKDVDNIKKDSSTFAATMDRDVVMAYPDEPLRLVVHRMAETGRTRLPVVERGEGRRLVGIVSLTDLLQARTRNLEAERRRERVLGLRVLFPSRARDASAGEGDAVA